MKTFSDNVGRTWTISVNVEAIRRVRDLASVNLLEVIEGKLIEQLISDPLLLCDVVYCLCKPEADAKSISDADFGRAMAGDAIDTATTALLEELVSFFPLGRRKVLAKALSKLRALEQTVLARAETKLDSPELEAELLRQLETLSSSSGLAPASSASISQP